MFEFSRDAFFRQLQLLPAKQETIETFEHSEYLQTQVFDKFKAGESFSLKDLDFDAFEMRHVTDQNLPAVYKEINCNWAKGFNRMVKRILPAAHTDRKFF